MLRIVLDTNVLVASISSKSPYYCIWQSFIDKQYSLCVTTEILNEYAEIIERYFSVKDAENTLTQISLSENVIPIIRYFAWDVMKNDPDDNKFFDCAVAAGAHYIVSEDNHFDIIKDLSFPLVKRIKTLEFKDFLNSLN